MLSRVSSISEIHSSQFSLSVSRSRLNVLLARPMPILHSPYKPPCTGVVFFFFFKLKHYAGDECLTQVGDSLTWREMSAQEYSSPQKPGERSPRNYRLPSHLLTARKKRGQGEGPSPQGCDRWPMVSFSFTGVKSQPLSLRVKYLPHGTEEPGTNTRIVISCSSCTC